MEKIIFHLTENDKRKLQEIAENESRTMSGTLRWMIGMVYDGMSVSVPVIGTISSEGIKITEEK